jgi:hypothetical protein
MSERQIRLKRIRSTKEAVALGVFYAGMLAFFLYAILNLVDSGP